VIEIKTVGLDDYLDGDGATSNIKVLLLGAPGTGKTRAASYWVRPLLIDTEGGRAVLADRQTPYVAVTSSKDADDVVRYLQKEAGKPSRTFDTIIIDTLDGYQKTLKKERLAKTGHTKLEAFEGDYDWLDAKLDAFITPILSLNVNVVCNIHIKSTGKVKDKGNEPAADDEDGLAIIQAWELDLLGGTRGRAAGWFDLVGSMENDWGLEKGKRVIKRQIRWQPTPAIPFLKDRLFAFPEVTPVNFAESDYTQLVEALTKKAERIMPATVVAQIPTEGATPVAANTPSGAVVAVPSGVLTRPRKAAVKKSAAKAAAKAPAATSEPAAVPPGFIDDAVSAVNAGLGGEVIAVELDFAAQADAATTRDQVRTIWGEAKGAGKLTSSLKAKLTVLAQKLQ
jgi:hypothetical protein